MLGRLIVVALVVAVVAVVALMVTTRQPQYRLPVGRGVELTEPVVIQKSREVLEIHGLEPIAPLPNPTGDGAAAYADWPDNPLYGYILWTVRNPATSQQERWQVRVKTLDDEFIGWPTPAAQEGSQAEPSSEEVTVP